MVYYKLKRGKMIKVTYKAFQQPEYTGTHENPSDMRDILRLFQEHNTDMYASVSDTAGLFSVNIVEKGNINLQTYNAKEELIGLLTDPEAVFSYSGNIKIHPTEKLKALLESMKVNPQWQEVA
jgi:hypothetical protein